MRRTRESMKRFLYNALRKHSQDFRARTDLFDDHYEKRADWKSGLGQGNHLLYAIVRCLAPEVIVEVGSARGKSTCSMALACKHNHRGKVYAIDPHVPNAWTEHDTGGDNEAFLRGRLRDYGLNAYCEVIKSTSRAVAQSWSQPIGFLFIDGDHSYEGVKADYEGFAPWLRDDALVFFHDTTWDDAHWKEVKALMNCPDEMGVPRFLGELKRDGLRSVTFSPLPGMTILDPKKGGFEFPG